MVLDQTGSLAGVSRHDYFPFGEEIGAGIGGRTIQQGYSQSDGVRNRFTGKERDDETGLNYFGARYYGSSIGRFSSTDPLLASGTIDDPQSWNRYSYSLNNPLRYIDPTGLWNWEASAGGDYTDEQLEARSNDKSLKKKERQTASRQLEFRRRFRAAREEAQNATSSSQLTQEQQEQISESVASYGTENDYNGVFVGVRDNKKGSAAVTMLNEDDTITVTFNVGLKDATLAVVLAHEGRHVGDNQAWLADFHCSQCDTDRNDYQLEKRAWNVGSYVAQALNLKSYGAGGGSDYDVWNRGWKTADRITIMRARGFENIARGRYESSDTQSKSYWHKHMPVP